MLKYLWKIILNFENIQAPQKVRERCQIESMTLIGNASLLDTAQLALFCSVKCPGHLILKTYDFAQELLEKHITVISGFHSPVEKEVLTNLLRGDQPIVICPARSIHNMRIPKDWKSVLESGQLLVLSAFNESQGRVTAKTAIQRNVFVAALAQQVFVAYAEPGGRTEHFCKQVLEWGTQILTFDTKDSVNLLDLGTTPIQETTILD